MKPLNQGCWFGSSLPGVPNCRGIPIWMDWMMGIRHIFRVCKVRNGNGGISRSGRAQVHPVLGHGFSIISVFL